MLLIKGFEKTQLWEDPVESGIVFGSVFVSLLSMCYFSLISVVAYVCLTTLVAVIGFKIYSYVMVNFMKKEVPINPLVKVSGKICISGPSAKREM